MKTAILLALVALLLTGTASAQDAAVRAKSEAEVRDCAAVPPANQADCVKAAAQDGRNAAYAAAQAPEQWITINSNMKFLIAQAGAGTESDGLVIKMFEAHIIENLPESDAVGAPESVRMTIRGDCRAKVYGVGEILTYSGKMARDSDALGGFAAGSDYADATRRVEPGTVMEKVFEAGCK
jgi:hypothetical protein